MQREAPTDRFAVEGRRLTKVFGTGADQVRALDDASIAIRPNEFFTLLGPSGCGKTTLLRLIAGFENATSGEILLDGEDISGLPPYKRPVNTVFQSYALFPHMTVAENIGFGLAMLKRPRDEIVATVDEMLRLVHMEALKSRRSSQLSGGQQQRVALARALAPRPKVLLLDEPLSALDLKLRKEMQIELKRLQHETGITFIFVTHDQEEALTMSDRIAVMNQGRILQVGTPHDIYERPADHFVADFIGDTNFLEGEIVETGDGWARVRAGGAHREIRATMASTGAPGRGDRVSIVVRPEHALIVKAGASPTLTGRVENVVYFGTDTHVHLQLEGGKAFTVRRQNRRGEEDGIMQGEEVGVLVPDDAAQVLRD
ncbi:MAG: polyamine ABC transporter ATP-binding protein [Rhizobiales bacterium]|nr:polyamine ABC transporter ATP-binding protein [Hyphomicrobiales bacterium]